MFMAEKSRSKKLDEIVRRENYGGKHVYVYYDPKTNKRKEWIYSKGKNIDKYTLINRLKETGSIIKGRVRERLIHVESVTDYTSYSKQYKEKSPILRVKKATTIQYIVEGDIIVNGNKISVYGASMSTHIDNIKEARKEARKHFWGRVADFYGADYTEKEGRKFIKEVFNYREGWRSFVEI